MRGRWLIWINGNPVRGSTAGCFESLKIYGSIICGRKSIRGEVVDIEVIG